MKTPTLPQPITEAMENLQYWRRQALIRQDSKARKEAAGLASAWQTTLAARVAEANKSKP